jgi:hypothetical protein
MVWVHAPDVWAQTVLFQGQIDCRRITAAIGKVDEYATCLQMHTWAERPGRHEVGSGGGCSSMLWRWRRFVLANPQIFQGDLITVIVFIPGRAADYFDCYVVLLRLLANKRGVGWTA